MVGNPAATQKSQVLLDLQQWVITLPKRLRYFLLHDTELRGIGTQCTTAGTGNKQGRAACHRRKRSESAHF
ncbi:MAG: hypothetical protein ABW168_07130 [Sedimenticola sp.]